MNFNLKAGIGSCLCGLAFAVCAVDLDLNGSWAFRFEEGRALEDVARVDFEATGTMPVPTCFDMTPQCLCKRGTALYRRTFALEQPVENAWLVIDGMGMRGSFAVDGRSLGVHPYPYARLELETGPLAAGEHEIFAALDNRFDWQTVKLASPNYDFYFFGGFYHGVRLSFDNRRLVVRTRDHHTGKVEIEAVNFPSRDFSSTLVFDGKAQVSAIFTNARATVAVPNFKLWSPESPNLHRVTLAGEKPVSARFGIRTVEARDRKIWLNGRELYLKGANRHESHPSFGAATPEAVMIADIQNLKALGGNFIRGAHYQQTARFLDFCDENGVLVWEEALGWGDDKKQLSDATFCDQQVWQTREMVRASMNHPCVIISGFLNEFKSHTKEGRALAERLVKAVRAEDSGHLITWANNRRNADDICSDLMDIISINTYPGWIDASFAGGSAALIANIKNGPTGIDSIVARHRAKGRQQPIIVSEMGTCGIYGQHDPTASQWTEEFQADYVGGVLDVVLSNPDLCGIALWQLTDARSYHSAYLMGAVLRNKPLAQNLAGLYDGFRRPKLVAQVVAEKFRATRDTSQTVVLEGHGGRVEVSLRGGRILSWRDAVGKEVFFMPRNPVSAGSEWSHGGLPLCWPWFGRRDGVIHGFVRTRTFTLRELSDVPGGKRAVLGFALRAGEEKSFPYACDFELELTCTDRLQLVMRTKNLGTEKFSFTSGVHPYFAVSGYEAITVDGVEEKEFALANGTDKAFARRGESVSFMDKAWQRGVRLTSSGAASVVVWAPGNIEPANRNLAIGETERFFGFGPCNSKGHPVELAPGAVHAFSCVFEVIH
ncbi:MAG: hypothetical protein MJ240_04000 [Kiritimatiellae bacterium]|nr:hypothetical protein [Kiritimatiellia bacterium]